MRPLLALAVLLHTALAGAQNAPPAERTLGSFAAERVAITPVQFWRADTTGWSTSADGNALKAAIDSAIAQEFRDRGMGGKWSFAGDVMRSARRNPTLRSDPSSLGAARWRNTPPVPGDQLPQLVADNLRVITALGDTRYALIPLEVRGASGLATLRIVFADTRMRTIVWTADLMVNAPNGVAAALAVRVADLVVDP